MLTPNTSKKLAFEAGKAKAEGRPQQEVADEFGVSQSCVSRILTTDPTRAGVGGRPEVITEKEEERIIKVLREHNYRLTFRQIEKKTLVPKSTFHRHFEKYPEKWKMSQQRLKQILTKTHIKERNAFSSRFKRCQQIPHVHIDEKWFYAFTLRGTMKIPAGDRAPRLECGNKAHIPKVMFLTAICKPIQWKHRRRTIKFNGKVGLWPFKYKHIAQRNSKHHDYGEEYDKYDVSVTGDVFAEMVIEQLFPALRAQFTGWSKIRVQMDNARTHTKGKNSKNPEGTPWDRIMKAAANPGEGECVIEIVLQPANSPDTNKCDLGFFASKWTRLPLRCAAFSWMTSSSTSWTRSRTTRRRALQSLTKLGIWCCSASPSVPATTLMPCRTARSTACRRTSLQFMMSGRLND